MFWHTLPIYYVFINVLEITVIKARTLLLIIQPLKSFLPAPKVGHIIKYTYTHIQINEVQWYSGQHV